MMFQIPSYVSIPANEALGKFHTVEYPGGFVDKDYT